jgi:hypothetical protein
MKTYKQWEKSGKDLEIFLSSGDRIDEELYDYIGECVSPAYCSRNFVQGGDIIKIEDDVTFYVTAHHTDDDRYIYLGVLPEFKG